MHDVYQGKHPILNMFIRKTNLLQSSFWTCMYRYVEYKCSLDKGKRKPPYWYALLFNIRMAVRKNEMDNSCCSYMYIIILEMIVCKTGVLMENNFILRDSVCLIYGIALQYKIGCLPVKQGINEISYSPLLSYQVKPKKSIVGVCQTHRLLLYTLWTEVSVEKKSFCTIVTVYLSEL